MGVAVIVALDLFTNSVAAHNLDRVTEFLMELGIRAQKYYATPAFLAGGGHTFTGLTADEQGIAVLTNLPVNDYGTFSIYVAGNESEVTLQGIGVEDGDKDGISCTANLRVLPRDMQITIVSR